jgi:hypothetical protein
MAGLAPAKAAPKKAPPRPAGKNPLQKKMSVGAASDRFEQEADRIAQRVGKPDAASAPPPSISSLPSIQRQALPPPSAGPERRRDKPAKPPEQRSQRKPAPGKADPRPAIEELAKPPEKRSQRKAAAGPPAKPKQLAAGPASKKPAGAQRAPQAANPEPVGREGGDVPDHVERGIDAMRARAAPGLDPALKQRVEAAVGSDLSAARVHKDAKAAAAADALGARAFTVGSDMFFGRGEFDPSTTAGQQLITHEAAHTVQQTGGSSAAKRVVRMKPKGKKEPTKIDPSKPVTKTKTLAGADWSLSVEPVEAAPKGGSIHLPKLELPKVVKKLKGEENSELEPASASGVLPQENKPFTRNPQTPREDREEGAAFEKWARAMQKDASPKLKEGLTAQLGSQKDAAKITKTGSDVAVYVLKRKNLKSDSLDLLLIGSIDELAVHDGLVRPMIGRGGGEAQYDADHILEDQLGGLDDATNMWLLDRSYNRSVGSQIKSKIDTAIKGVLDKAQSEADAQRGKNVEFDGKIPDDVQVVKQNWQIVFDTVSEGKFGGEPKNYWTRKEIAAGSHLKHFAALSERELARQGFKFDANQKPTRINVFPTKAGGRPMAFTVSPDGKSLKRPGYFFRGIQVDGEPVYDAGALKEDDTVLIKIPVTYTKKKGGKGKDKGDLISASGEVVVKHDRLLGFGGYVSRDSIVAMFKDSDFKPLSPIAFPDVSINPEGDLVASGTIKTSKQLLSGLQVPISLLGTDIFVSFPLPPGNLSFGPVHAVDPAISLGVGDNGFFMEGSTGIAVDQVGQGKLSARAEKDDVVLAGEFDFDMDFLNPASMAVSYSLANDDFVAKTTVGIKKNALPGIETGTVTVELTRDSVGVNGSLGFGGVLKGSTLTVGYTKETGLVLEAKDIPLPLAKLPGVSEAALTVKAARDPVKGEWSVSGGGKAKFGVAGAKGELDILYDGVATSFTGRVDVAKGPATGWLQVSGTNRAIDDKGNPIENGPVGDFKIWGKGEASVIFGKVLKGTAGIEYTPDGRVIVSGEIAMPPTYDLFPRKDLSPKEPLLNIEPPAFPIWGVSLGPVDIGILAFVKATVSAEAWVGPGQLRDAKISATLDLDKPEEAVVDGSAKFVLPSYAGLDLYLGGGLKASAAIAYVRGDVGLFGKLGLGLDAGFDVNVHWGPAQGVSVAADATLAAKPKFEVGLRASVTAGVTLPWPLPDIDHTWGPWEKKLGEFGPDMALTATFPMKWSEAEGLDIDPSKIKIDPPKLDAKELMKSGFDMLV